MAYAWGKGDRFGGGSKHHNEWNKSLLWKGHVEREAALSGFSAPTNGVKSDYHSLPTHMRHLAKTIQRSPKGKKIRKDTLSHEAKVTAEFRASYKPDTIPKPTLKLGYGHAKLSDDVLAPSEASSVITDAPTTGRSASSSILPPITPTSSARTEDRLRYLEEKLHYFESTQRATRSKLAKQNKKLKAYEDVMSKLVSAVDKARARRGYTS